MPDVFCEFCFRLRHTCEHEFRGGATTHFFLRHSDILHYPEKFYVVHFCISIELQYLMFPTMLIHYHRKTRLNFKMPFSDNPGQNYWDNRLKITPEFNFPSEQSKSSPPFPPNNVDDHLHQPLFAFNFFQPTLDRGRGG